MSRFILFATVCTLPFLSIAQVQAADKSPHDWKFKLTLQSEHHSNIGAAPGAVGGDLVGWDQDDLLDEDTIADTLDELTDEELDEIIGDIDLDNDGIDDAIDGSTGANSRKDSAWRNSITTDLGYRYRFSRLLDWKMGAKFAANRNTDRDELDRANYALTTGVVVNITDTVALQPSLSFASLAKDGNRTTDQWIASIGAGWDITKQWQLAASYNYQDRDMVDPAGTDAELDVLKLQANYKPTKKDKISAAFSPNFEDASQSAREKNRVAYQLKYEHEPLKDLTLALAVKYSVTDYDVQPRTDKDGLYSFGVAKEFDQGFFVGSQLAYKNRNSNIDSKSNHDKIMMVQTGWKF